MACADENNYSGGLSLKLAEFEKSAEEGNSDMTHEDIVSLQELTKEYEEYLRKSFSLLKLESPAVTMTGTDVSSSDILRSRAEMLCAELDVAQKFKATGIPNHPPLLLELAKDNLTKQVAYLEQGLSALKEEEASLVKENERLDFLLKTESKALTLLKDELKVVDEEEIIENGNKKIQEMEEKCIKVKKLTNLRMEQLEDFVITNFPPPNARALKKSQKKGVLFEEISAPEIKTLGETLEDCMNKWLESPHDPWIILDETFWPPYIELLLKTRIIQRHPQNYDWIRIGSYHL